MSGPTVDWRDPDVVARCLALHAGGASAATIAATLSEELGLDPPLRKDQVQKRLRVLRLGQGDRRVGRPHIWRIEATPRDRDAESTTFYVRATALEHLHLIDALERRNTVDDYRVSWCEAGATLTLFAHLFDTPDGEAERARRRATREIAERWQRLEALGDADDAIGYMDAWIAMTPTVGDDIRALASAIRWETSQRSASGMDAVAKLARDLLTRDFDMGCRRRYWEAERLVILLERGAYKAWDRAFRASSETRRTPAR